MNVVHSPAESIEDIIILYQLKYSLDENCFPNEDDLCKTYRLYGKLNLLSDIRDILHKHQYHFIDYFPELYLAIHSFSLDKAE
jgi:hypothetical protein